MFEDKDLDPDERRRHHEMYMEERLDEELSERLMQFFGGIEN